MRFDLSRRLVAEFLGTLMLVMTVVGSGIMADDLTMDVALALLGNTVPTGAILIVLITVLGPISGAHFNPVVSMVFSLKGDLAWSELPSYIMAQIFGGVAGVFIAHLMFELPVLQFSSTVRTGVGQWCAEFIATFGLVWVILNGLKTSTTSVPWLVGLYITAAYWFTSSTSFANPAVAIARAFSDTFAGIRPIDVLPFILVQMAAAYIAYCFCRWFLTTSNDH